MALLLREADVAGLLEMDPIVAAIEAAMRDLGSGAASNQPRQRVFAPGGLLNVMFAALPSAGCTGVKSYTVADGRARFLVTLFGLDGVPLALIEADRMGTFRTGAATGVAARALANPGRLRAGVIGSGWQARTQVQALSRCLDLSEVAVFSRDPERRSRFASDCERDFGLRVVPAATAEEAVRGSGVVVAITTSAEPVFEASWVEPGALVVGAGSNFPSRCEIPAALVAAAETVVVDQVETARNESGDLIQAEAAGAFDWGRAVALGDVLAGGAAGRLSEAGIVLFESHGLALWDVAAGAVVLAAARSRGAGETIELLP